jgi:glycerate kinase
MRIVIAPDKLKDSLSAREAADAIAVGIRREIPDAHLDLCPIADGGDGTLDALVAATGGRIERRRVTGPLPEMKVDAPFGVLGDGTTAVVEMAAASGLALLKNEDRNPLNTTTFGTGELLVAAATTPGVERIILAIGGSATTDAGIGCAQACGLPVILEGGEPVSPTEPLCGRDLPSVVLVKHGRGSPVERVKIVVACDVTNPLYGPNGAASIFGPQKGATPEIVRELDDSLRALALRLGKDAEANTPGAGAAGGLGFGMLAYFPNATLRSGFEIVADAVQLDRRLMRAQFCITGEGRFDRSTMSGKSVAGIAQLCRRAGIPCIALVGSVGEGHEDVARELNVAVRIIAPSGMPVDESLANALGLLADAAAKCVKDWRERPSNSSVL